MTFPKTTALDLAPPDPLPDEVAALFAKCQEKLRLVPNVLVAYAHNPDKLRAFSQMYNTLMLSKGGLTKLEREMIAVAVSAVNRCWYCLVAHGAAVRVMSGNPELGDALALDHRFANLSARERALVDFARKLTLTSSEIGEADRALLRAQGLTDADIWDAAEVAAFFNMTNRLSSAVAMVPNPEYHLQGREG
ncbi:MAG TPA: peroxidase-related enzyme [Thermohalobaculum sp.]|nr:peroxidase-related enzyme [Thermohalobaculum sp.]